MAYVETGSIARSAGRHEMTGSIAIRLAEKAHSDGRFDEARGLVELAYRLFDDAADVVSTPETACRGELYALDQ